MNKRKASAAIALGIVALAAAVTTGCNDDDQTRDVRACVDRTGQVLPDSYCQQQAQTANGQNPTDNDHLLRDILLYHWVFGGNYSNNYYLGGGGYRPSRTVIYVPSYSSEGSAIRSAGSARSYGVRMGGGYGGVARGGFGSSFSGGHSSFGG